MCHYYLRFSLRQHQPLRLTWSLSAALVAESQLVRVERDLFARSIRRQLSLFSCTLSWLLSQGSVVVSLVRQNLEGLIGQLYELPVCLSRSQAVKQSDTFGRHLGQRITSLHPLLGLLLRSPLVGFVAGLKQNLSARIDLMWLLLPLSWRRFKLSQHNQVSTAVRLRSAYSELNTLMTLC